MIPKPSSNEYEGFFERYVNLVPGEDALQALQQQQHQVDSLLRNLPEEQAQRAYAEGKWTVKQLLGHLIDTERIMNYRALCFSRNEKQPLPGFDENDYVAHAGFNERTIASLLEDYAVVRQGTLLLFGKMPAPMLTRTGTANQNTLSVRALAYVIAGHELHHLQILRSRYGLG